MSYKGIEDAICYYMSDLEDLQMCVGDGRQPDDWTTEEEMLWDSYEEKIDDCKRMLKTIYSWQ